MLEERGYRRTWPPRMGDLTRRDEQMIVLGEQAETYIEHRLTQQAQGRDRGLSQSHYDSNSSRREWEQQFQ